MVSLNTVDKHSNFKIVFHSETTYKFCSRMNLINVINYKIIGNNISFNSEGKSFNHKSSEATEFYRLSSRESHCLCTNFHRVPHTRGISKEWGPEFSCETKGESADDACCVLRITSFRFCSRFRCSFPFSFLFFFLFFMYHSST